MDTIVLLGEFISRKNSDTMDYQSMQYWFESLASMIKEFDRLREEVRWIIVPGINDPASEKILPQMGMYEFFFE